jgi:histidinol dehydrogenase
MLKLYPPEEALRTILVRQSPDDLPISPKVQENITKIFGEALSPAQVVNKILVDVRTRGNAALHEWTERLDGKSPEEMAVSGKDLQDALAAISNTDRQLLETAADRIRRFHQSQPVISWMTQSMGGTLGQLIRPISRVGLYIPAGNAPLPSSVLMSAIPAQVAGVKEIVIAAPPQRSTGQIAPIILAAAALLGITEVYAMGGAQAIAALAYGTETIRRVDKIFGPGNLFVTLAKRQVYGVVGIDGLAGPTETMVIADEYARPDWVAADLLAQAEHDVLAAAILLSPSKTLIEAVQIEVGRQLEQRGRSNIIAASLDNRSGAVLTANLEEAVQIANAYAPEHLCLAVREPWAWAEKVNAAGGVFIGEQSFEVLGDYVAGPSHVMPTSGTARFASPLNVLDFIHLISLIALNPETTQAIASTAAGIARMEGLDGHAAAAEARL